MLKCKIEKTDNAKGEVTIFINPKCGHEQRAEYSMPYKCQHDNCDEAIPSVTKLLYKYNQDERVKHFVEGKL